MVAVFFAACSEPPDTVTNLAPDDERVETMVDGFPTAVTHGLSDVDPTFRYGDDTPRSTGNDGRALAHGPDHVKLGIWFPYISSDGVPPLADLAAEGIDGTFITGDIDAGVLATYDVLFIGRTGMMGFGVGNGKVIQDIDALVQWVADGGGVIGESEAFLRDSDIRRGLPWSSRLSEVAGVWSSQPNSVDWGVRNPPVTITNPTHPVAQGVTGSFLLAGTQAVEVHAFLDSGRNPTAVEVGTVDGGFLGTAPIVAAEYGDGCSVYFPPAVGYTGMDWSANPDYFRLFVNAVNYCGGQSNQPPTADASGTPTIVECTDNEGAPGTEVSLVGAGSDPDGTIVAWEWTDEDGNVLASTQNATVSLSHGDHTLTLTVTDDDGATGSDQVTVSVVDTTPPEIDFGLDVTEIWPANHRMVTVATGIGAWDACDDAPVVDIQVTSNEDVNGTGTGDGSHAPDWTVIDNGDGTFDVEVRAERDGTGDGRIYTITVTATDGSGNVETTSGEVSVPHDRRGGRGR